MGSKLFFVLLSYVIWNLDQKTFIFVYGKSTTVSTNDLPHGNTSKIFEEKLFDLFSTDNELSLEDINSLVSDDTGDISQKIKVVLDVKDRITSLKEKLQRQVFAKSRNEEQTDLVTVTETSFNAGKVMDLSRHDLDYETGQMATTIPNSSENYTFEEPSEIEKTSETVIYSSLYNDQEGRNRSLLENGYITPDMNTKEFRLFSTTEPSLNDLTNNSPTKIRVVEKTAGVITESTKDYSTSIHPTTVKTHSTEHEEKQHKVSLGNSRTPDRFRVTSEPQKISSTEKAIFQPDPSSVSSNIISPETTSTDRYATTFSSKGQHKEISRIDKSKYSEIGILGTALEQRKSDAKYTTFDADGYNFLINSIFADVLENIFSYVLRNNGGVFEEIRNTDQLSVKKMEDDLPEDYVEVYKDIMELFRLYVLRVIHVQSSDDIYFYHNTSNTSTP